MSPTDASAPDPQPSKAPTWKRVGIAALLLGVLLFVLIRGGGPPPEEEPAPPAARQNRQIHIPLPPTPHKDLLEEARGIYILEHDQARFSLELLAGGRFRFTSHRRNQEPRKATGTWNLVGRRLTMVYRTINGAPVEESTVVSNVHRGRTIELRDTGLEFPVVLTKRTMMRER